MEIKAEIKEFFEDNFMAEFDDDFSDDDSFLENGIIDSTGVLEVILYLEETFSIKIEDEEITPENLDTLNNMQKFITKKQNQ